MNWKVSPPKRFLGILTALIGLAFLVVLAFSLNALLASRVSQTASQPQPEKQPSTTVVVETPATSSLVSTPPIPVPTTATRRSTLHILLSPGSPSGRAKYAHTIVIGEARRHLPGRITDKTANTELVYTDVVFSVEKYLKNPLPLKEIVVRVLGGTAGNRTLTVNVSPSLVPGEKLLLFLSKEAPEGIWGPASKLGENEFVIAGWHYGAYAIHGDQAIRKDGRETRQLDDLLETIADSQ